ncbi:hypothetical protein D9757_003123 [Collybiopsis confluens]|uniref:Uncharacterized protein n=1 Tax=Collybiopsis confluens TaxID=2823264 RepID=A0A8H5HX51_9AGAR|nr:hypothetical protein D9757_003123 [Collybiopsis confluens]
MLLSSLAALISVAVLVTASPAARDVGVCTGEVVVSETFIGEEKNVKLQHVSCPVAPTVAKRAIAPRQTSDVCGNACETNCFSSGSEPTSNDCHVIADALRFQSQNESALFEIETGVNNTVVLTFETCTTFYVNQDPFDQLYCRTDWATLVDFASHVLS